MSNASFGKSLKNKGAIGTDKLENILRIYNDLSPEWLMTGRGSMLKTKGNPNAVDTYNKPLSSSKDTIKVLNGQEKNAINTHNGIPLIPLDAVAGFPATDSSFAYMENCERYIIPEFQDKGADFIIRVSGDSMIPLYYSGDLIACHKIHDIRFFQWGTVYVLETSQGVLVKRVMESIEHDDCILCASENDTVHRPFLLPKDDIRSMSTIVGLIRIV